MQHINATRMVRLYREIDLTCMSVGAFKLVLGLARGETDAAIKYLLEHKLIRHHKRGCYELTATGKAAATSPDGVLKSKTGVATNATQQQTKGADGIRGAAWRALRIAPNMTMDEILSRIDDGQTPNARMRVLRYLAGLTAVGVIRRKAKAYLLVNDLGPIAPTVGQRGQVFDPNAGALVGVKQ